MYTTVHSSCQQKQEGRGFPETGITNGSKSTCGFWEPNASSLERAVAALNCWSTLAPPPAKGDLNKVHHWSNWQNVSVFTFVIITIQYRFESSFLSFFSFNIFVFDIGFLYIVQAGLEFSM